ncbi:methyltransferase domain-containing protein [Jeotgalicoccus halotolerans]|uniref:class I SAM-dependent methyltransferase n=1 Tax=Jeotgalicoccus halotolerans TaxID=157227 RepID=UPI0035130232
MDIKQDVKQQFGRSSDSYVNSKIHGKGEDLKTLIEMAHASKSETALDVATGGGHTANALAPVVHKVTAMDLTPEMLVSAEKFITGNGHTNVEFVEGDAEKMPFKNGTFDLVTCRIAPHHFPNVKDFIKEVYRVLKPGGRFVLNDNVAPENDEFDFFYNKIEKLRDYSHFRAWKKTEWLSMLEAENFEIHELHRFEKHFEFEDWCNRMHLTNPEIENLTSFMLAANKNVKRKFRIQTNQDKIESFQGEAVLLSCVKW